MWLHRPNEKWTGTNLAAPLERHLRKVRIQHEEDLEAGFGSVYLPTALERKLPNAQKEWCWQYVFPSVRLSLDPRAKADREPVKRRHHVEEGALQIAVKKAVRAADVNKAASRTVFRTNLPISVLFQVVGQCAA